MALKDAFDKASRWASGEDDLEPTDEQEGPSETEGADAHVDDAQISSNVAEAAADSNRSDLDDDIV